MLLLFSVYLISCSKPDLTPEDPCPDTKIILNAVITPTSGGTATNGSLSVTATGSTGFMYKLDNGPFQHSGNFPNLAAGSYLITAKDVNSCTAAKSFIISATPCPAITVSVTTTQASSNTASDGTILATAVGSTSLTYSINNISFQSTGNFTGLPAGSYTVIAKDINGCTGTAIVVVTSFTCPVITVAAVTTVTAGPTATNGTLTAVATGGTGPYLYSKDGGLIYQPSGNFNNLSVGNYTIVAKDVNACLGSTGAVAVLSAPCPTINITSLIIPSDKCTNNTGSVTVNATGSTGFTFNINNGVFQSSNSFAALGTGNYTVGVKDVNGCVNTAPAAVNVAPPGPTFSLVKNIISNNCAISGCHAGASPQNGLDFNDDCTIVSQRIRIRDRAVDGIPTVMPPFGSLSAADKQRILDWINAGGQHSN